MDGGQDTHTRTDGRRRFGGIWLAQRVVVCRGREFWKIEIEEEKNGLIE